VGPAARLFAQPFDEVDLAPSVDACSHLPPDVRRVIHYVAGGNCGIESELVVTRDYLEVGEIFFGAGKAEQNDPHLEGLAVGGVVNEPTGVGRDFAAPYFAVRDNALDHGVGVTDYALAEEDVVKCGPSFISICGNKSLKGGDQGVEQFGALGF